MKEIDILKRFPDQNEEHRTMGCVGETIADIGGNIFGIPMDAGFSEAAGYAVNGLPPSDKGQNAFAGMQGAVGYGMLPIAKETFDSKQKGELYENTFVNYSDDQKKAALAYALNGAIVLPNIQEIARHLYQTNIGVQMSMRWYGSFWDRMGPGGTLIAPSGGESYTIHSVAVYDITSDGKLKVKPFLGKNFGQRGYCYIEPVLFPLFFISASGFTPDAFRWVSLLGIAATRYPFMLSLLPIIIGNGLKKKP